MDDNKYSVISRRLKEALRSVDDDTYVNLRKVTCEHLKELYDNCIVVRAKIIMPGTRPKLGKEEITGVKHDEDESDRETSTIKYHVNRSECDEILNEAIDLNCDWALEELRKMGKFRVIGYKELKLK